MGRKGCLLTLCLLFLTGCGTAATPWTVTQEQVVTFSDGVSVDLWNDMEHGGSFIWGDSYRLPDGTELLNVRNSGGPEHMSVDGIENFQDLSEPAQENVLAFYTRQGALYDVPNLLNGAYGAYLDCQKSHKTFSSWMVTQDVSPTASNPRFMCFLTATGLPLGEQMMTDRRVGAIFDRKTGEPLNPWDLFTLPEAESRRLLLDRAQIADATLLAELEAALTGEMLIFFPDCLEIAFPRGSLHSQTESYFITMDYVDLQDLLQPWAVPDARSE